MGVGGKEIRIQNSESLVAAFYSDFRFRVPTSGTPHP